MERQMPLEEFKNRLIAKMESKLELEGRCRSLIPPEGLDLSKPPEGMEFVLNFKWRVCPKCGHADMEFPVGIFPLLAGD